MTFYKSNLDNIQESRRTFIKHGALLGSGILVFPIEGCTPKPATGMVLTPSEIIGLNQVDGENLLEKAQWYTGDNVKNGFNYRFKAGTLADMKYITTDMLADGNNMIQFNVELQEGEDGRIFQFAFGVLNHCSLRMRLPLALVDQNTWRIPRDGAFLKPMCWGDRVELEKVDRMNFYINRKSDQTSRFCLTDMLATKEEVPVIEHPVLPKGKLLDEMGQSTIHDWVIQKLKQSGDSLRSICRKLEKRGYKTKTGKPNWHPQLIYQIVNRK